ncbi:MAG: prephenate dehydrogenase [Opitutales bacterium]
MFSTIAILGPGLLGASAGIAAQQAQVSKKIVAWARKSEVRVLCEESGWCDAVYSDAQEAVKDADLVIICTPVHTILPIYESIAPALKPGAIVTDVGSTKSVIVRHARAHTPEGTYFIGSHPMAGSEKNGFTAGRGDLFQNRACLVTPLDTTPDAQLDSVVRFWKRLGMHVHSVSPEDHDEIVANISHLPHVLASVLCSYLDTRPHNWRDFAGGGLRDTTRIAGGDPGLWREILEQNTEEILRAIHGFQEELHTLESALRNKQPASILNILQRGQIYRARLNPHTSDHDSA